MSICIVLVWQKVLKLENSMGKEYTHVLTFKNNETKDFFELNEQYPLNGVTSDRTYTFYITLDASSGTYEKEFVVRVSDVARNYLETSVNSFVPEPGAEFWIDVCAYVWKADEESSSDNAVKKVEIDESTDDKPAYSFFFADSAESVDTYFFVDRVGKRSTFTAKDITFPTYITLRASITYNALHVEGIIKEIPMNRKMLLISKRAYDGIAYSETYEYIYTLYHSQTIQLHLLCPSLEQD